MPRACTVYTHPERETIEKALIEGEPSRALSARYGTVGRMALQRHKAEHLPEKMAKAQEAVEVAQADDLLDQMRGLQARTLAILEAAEETHQYRTALAAIREARSNLELLAKLLGELDERPVMNVLVSAEWVMVRTAMMEALGPYTQARVAVAEHLSELEGH